MKNIKSIIITLTIIILGSILPATQTKAMETIEPEAIQYQLVTLKCCNIAYHRTLLRSNLSAVTPQECADVDTYNTFINMLEAQGMSWNDISSYIQMK